MDAQATPPEPGSPSRPTEPRPAPPGAGPTPPIRLALVVDQFPELSETFIAEEARALRELGHPVRVEARTHAAHPNPAAAADIPFAVAADDGITRKLVDVAWLTLRHPLRCARDLLGRRRWRREEPLRSLRSLAPSARRVARAGETHLHAHFAAGAALDALRLGDLLGLPYSVMAHAYDIFREPSNLREKLARARFAAGVANSTVAHLRGVVGSADAIRIQKLTVGIDPNRFRRSAPQREGRLVAAIGRLVEKKGFAHLIDAVALLERSSPLERLVVLGDGPLADSLRSQAEGLGVGDRVDWLGARPPGEVRRLLERVDLLAMPCVVARDGDRDGSPVVVKEALAMEVPVVASDGFGMEEVVRPEWGRLVPAGDAAALAAAIEEVLTLPPERRREMGRAGRAWVVRGWNLYRETEKLAALIAASGERSGQRLGALGRIRRCPSWTRY